VSGDLNISENWRTVCPVTGNVALTLVFLRFLRATAC